MSPVRSTLLGQEGSLTSAMKRAILEVIASGVSTAPSHIHEYAKCTLLYYTLDQVAEQGLQNDGKGIFRDF